MERAFTENTEAAYRKDLQSFTRFLAGRGVDVERLAPENITRREIRAYLIHLAGERHLKSSSISRHLACLRSFFRFLAPDERWQLGHDPTLGVAHPKIARRVPAVLSVPGVERLLQAAERSTSDPRRNRAIFQFLVQTGCRVGEPCRLELPHLGLKRGAATLLG